MTPSLTEILSEMEARAKFRRKLDIDRLITALKKAIEQRDVSIDTEPWRERHNEEIAAILLGEGK